MRGSALINCGWEDVPLSPGMRYLALGIPKGGGSVPAPHLIVSNDGYSKG